MFNIFFIIMFFKNAVIFIFILSQVIEILSLTIQFYSNKNLSITSTTSEILDSLKNNIRYTYLKIGDTSQKLAAILTSHDSYSIINKADYSIKSNYNINISNSVQIFYDNTMRYYFIKDYISFDDIYKNIFLGFIYYNQTDELIENNYAYIGIQNTANDKKGNLNTNLFTQLKDMNYIDKTIIYFNYTKNNNLLLNIGVEPFEVNPILYSEKNMKIINVDYILDYEKKVDNTGKYRWNLNLTKVFYFKKLPIQSNLDPYVEISRKNTRRVNFFQALLIPEDNLIKGPFEYEVQIEDDFFDKFIKDNICKKINFERKYFFICKKEYKYLLENNFPSLYFYIKELDYMFELNFQDLFIEQKDYLIFSIYFDYFQIEVFVGAFLSEWFFGKTFLKKYCFSFDIDNGKIRFYKENKIKKNNNKTIENNNNDNIINIRYYQLGLIFIILAIAVIAFICDRVAKRKSRISNTLIDYKLNV